ncbi:hypothetical protein LX32DRAFT_87444 [Colletotrichum zoysiae]|uniref:Uncharacterized protein n=1 Tax=Colletotrichum zoysiae TaxID=1216348 RepID=A0AAD9HQE5_9PEZI|nr:hypothetical protein LX32DRAFT_87444 [Colletotrichum zoysiae]
MDPWPVFPRPRSHLFFSPTIHPLYVRSTSRYLPGATTRSLASSLQYKPWRCLRRLTCRASMIALLLPYLLLHILSLATKTPPIHQVKVS